MIVETSYRKQAIKYYSICTGVHVEDEDESSPRRIWSPAILWGVVRNCLPEQQIDIWWTFLPIALLPGGIKLKSYSLIAVILKRYQIYFVALFIISTLRVLVDFAFCSLPHDHSSFCLLIGMCMFWNWRRPSLHTFASLESSELLAKVEAVFFQGWW